MVTTKNFKTKQSSAINSGRPRGTCGKQPKPEDKKATTPEVIIKEKKNQDGDEYRADVKDGRAGIDGLGADPVHEVDAELQAHGMDLIGDRPEPSATSARRAPPWGRGRTPHWARLSKPYAPTPEPAAILRYQPLGGRAVSCCCRRSSPAKPSVGTADAEIRDVRRRATQSMPAMEMRCGRLSAGSAAAGNYSEAVGPVDWGGGVRWRSSHMHACMHTQVWTRPLTHCPTWIRSLPWPSIS